MATSPKQQAAKRVVAARKSRTTAKKAPPEITDVSTWKQSRKPRPLELPSGHTALVRNPGMMSFIERGVIPNSLLGIVNDAMNEGKPPSKDDLGSMLNDPDRIRDMNLLMNSVLVACVVQPEVHPVPTLEIERDDDLLYADEVDLEDKMFIFQWVVGGTHSLEQFRQEQTALVADLQPSEDVGSPT